jgi:hypothetical protein
MIIKRTSEAFRIAAELAKHDDPQVVALCHWVLTDAKSYRDYMRHYMRDWRKRRKQQQAAEAS